MLALFGWSRVTNAQYTKLLDFAGAANGSRAYGSLLSDGTYLYGTGANGGVNDKGVVFKIKPDGTGYSKLLDFAGAANGSYPNGALISDGTFLYGMTSTGGPNDLGAIFKIMPDGAGYVKILDFAGTVNGSRPSGSLISVGSFLYGMTQLGGTNNKGVIFKIMPDGSGYTKLLDFAGTTNGSSPYGSLISDGTFLYGMTDQGGTNNKGVIFKIMPDGSGFTKILDFAGATNGSRPNGSLVYDGTFLYGMTYLGGANNMGVLFKLMPDGTGFSKLLDFSGVTNGSYPQGSLLAAGTSLYGMTSAGGANDKGIMFKIITDGSGYSKLIDFAGAVNGSSPTFNSFISIGNFLYATTPFGGPSDMGTIFKYGISTTGIIDGAADFRLKIYPNPANGVFQIQNSALYKIEIFNVMGAAIPYQQNADEIDISNSPKGFYFVKIYDGLNIYTQKIIIQ